MMPTPPTVEPRRPSRALTGMACRAVLLAALWPAAGCAGGPDTKDGNGQETAADEADPDRLTDVVVQPEQDQAEPFHKMLLKADFVLDGYVRAVTNSSRDRPDSNAAAMEAYLRKVAGAYQRQLELAAVDGDNPANRSIAVALLGFAPPDRDVLDLIVQGAMSGDEVLRNNGCLGLGILRHPNTPIQVLQGILEDDEESEPVRACAAWSLYEVQEAVYDKGPVLAIWRGILSRPHPAVDPLVAVQALRGVGLGRSEEDLELILDWLEHPRAKVRAAAITAMARIGSLEVTDRLIALLGDLEPNPNVRLHARKALQQLSGGLDRGYDQREWRKVFEFMTEDAARAAAEAAPGSGDG